MKKFHTTSDEVTCLETNERCCCTSISNLTVHLDRRDILRNINIHFHCGEFTAIAGTNGAGKSTLLKAILGEIPYSGKINFSHASEKSRKKIRIGHVPQHFDFDRLAPITVKDLFASALSRFSLLVGHSTSLTNTATNSLSIFNAAHLLNNKLGTLSGGELQRVLLALAMTPAPDLLLLDEPISGVDKNGEIDFYKAVSDLRKKFDLSIVVISHDFEIISNFAERMIVLNQGEIICDDTPTETLKNALVKKTLGLYTQEEVHSLITRSML